MTENELDPLSRVIGGLEIAVKNLTDVSQRQDAAATEGRHALYQKFNELKDQVVKSINDFTIGINNRVTAIEGRLGSVEQKLTIMAPALDRLTGDRSERAGSKKALAGVWAAVIGLAGAAAAFAIKAIDLLWPPRH